MTKRGQIWRDRAPIVVSGIILAVLVVGALLVFPLLEDEGQAAKAAVPDISVGGCEESLKVCRAGCDGEEKQSCLADCRKDYDACRTSDR